MAYIDRESISWCEDIVCMATLDVAGQWRGIALSVVCCRVDRGCGGGSPAAQSTLSAQLV